MEEEEQLHLSIALRLAGQWRAVQGALAAASATYPGSRWCLDLPALANCVTSLSCIVTQSTSGLIIGMLLFLVAAGVSLIFGVLKVINFAHGSLYMLGAYFASTV